jgi:hypothetical protein
MSSTLSKYKTHSFIKNKGRRKNRKVQKRQKENNGGRQKKKFYNQSAVLNWNCKNFHCCD